MNNERNLVKKIIKDLINPDRKLSDIFLSVKVLAFKIKKKKLSEWVNLEINGYKGTNRSEIPSYREIPCALYGNLIQSTFSHAFTKQKVALPTLNLKKEIQDYIKSVKMDAGIQEIERMIESNGDYQINLPREIYHELSKDLNNWSVDSAYLKISLPPVEGILGKIKSQLLEFLLEFLLEYEEEFGENISPKNDEKIFEDIFNKNIKAENINITLGGNSTQIVNSGDNSSFKLNIGDKINNNENIAEFIELLKTNLKELELEDDDVEEMNDEINRLSTQIQREKPKLTIVNSALSTIYNLLTSVTANAITPVVLEKLQTLIS